MKNLFKFIPVALAAIALASCSSDELDGLNGAKELEYSPDKLFVQVEGADDATRGGFMTTVSDYTLKSALFFDNGDKMKLYHDATSWRPEVWTATDFGQYKNKQGIAVFEGEGEIKADENAYGIFPADLGQFGNENRTSLLYDLSCMKFIDYSAVAKNYTLNSGEVIEAATDITGNTKAYAAPFPLWGVKAAGNQVMTVKHLAGILRVDMAAGSLGLSSLSADEAKFIIIKSKNNKVLSGSLQTAANLLAPTDIEKVDPSTLMTTTPKLVTTDNAKSATDIKSATFPITAAGIGDDIIVVKVTKDDPEHIMLFVPITPEIEGGDIEVYISSAYDVSGDPTELDFSSDSELDAPKYTLTAEKIAEENDLQKWEGETTVQRGVFYRINDDAANIVDDIKTPFDLAKAIYDADKKAYRDFELTIKSPVLVKNDAGTSTHNFVLDLSGATPEYGIKDYVGADGWTLKHNVTVNLTIEGDASTPNRTNLIIRTKEGSKKLIMNITNSKIKAVDSITVDGMLKSELVLKTPTPATVKLPAIVNYGTSGKVTVAAATDLVKTNNNNLIIDAKDCTIAKLLVLDNKGTDYEVSLNNGIVAEVELPDPTSAYAYNREGLLTNNVTIASTGKSAIQKAPAIEGKSNDTEAKAQGIDYVTVGTTRYPKYTIYYTSVWDGKSEFTDEKAAQLTAANGYKIYTAAQLAVIKGNTADYTLMTKTMDLDKKEWTPKALQKSFSGVDVHADIYTNEGTKKEVLYSDIKNLSINSIQAAATGTGFFSNVQIKADAEIENLTFTDAVINGGTSDVAAERIGIVAGQVTPATNKILTVSNITIANGKIDTHEGSMTEYNQIGGVIGFANTGASGSNVDLVNVDVKKLEIVGYTKMGGLIGVLQKAGNIGGAYFEENKSCDISDLKFKFVEPTTSYIYDYAFKEVGAYIGYALATNAADLNVSYDNDAAINYTTEGTSSTTCLLGAGQDLYGLAKWSEKVGSQTKYYDIVLPQKMIGFSSFNGTGYQERKATFYTYGHDVPVVMSTSDTKVADTSHTLTYIDK